MKHFYISGPMSGLPGLNFAAFHAEAIRLRGLGYEVVNPAELNTDPDAEWSTCLRKDIIELMDCRGVAMLPGWNLSRGACLERDIAERLGMRICLASEVTEQVPA